MVTTNIQDTISQSSICEINGKHRCGDTITDVILPSIHNIINNVIVDVQKYTNIALVHLFVNKDIF